MKRSNSMIHDELSVNVIDAIKVSRLRGDGTIIKDAEFFSDISPEETEMIKELAEINLMVALVRFEIENTGKFPTWVIRLREAEKRIEGLV